MRMCVHKLTKNLTKLNIIEWDILSKFYSKFVSLRSHVTREFRTQICIVIRSMTHTDSKDWIWRIGSRRHKASFRERISLDVTRRIRLELSTLMPAFVCDSFPPFLVNNCDSMRDSQPPPGLPSLARFQLPGQQLRHLGYPPSAILILLTLLLRSWAFFVKTRCFAFFSLLFSFFFFPPPTLYGAFSFL